MQCTGTVKETPMNHVQGDHSGSEKPPVDIKTKVVVLVHDMSLILTELLFFGVNGRFVTT